MLNIQQDGNLPGFAGGGYTDIIKALSASGQGGPSGANLIPESLEPEAYSVLWDDRHMKLTKMLPVVRSTAIAHEFARITGYTSLDTDGFFPDGGLPNSAQLVSERVVEHLRPLGEEHSVTGPQAAVRVLAGLGVGPDIIAVSRRAKLLALLQKITKASYFSHTVGHASTATTKFRGIDQILEEDAPATHTIDLKGKSITQDDIDLAAELINSDFGYMTHINASMGAVSNYGKTLENIRHVVGLSGGVESAGYYGRRVKDVDHMFGRSELVADIFLNSQYSRFKTPPVYDATTNPTPDNLPAAPTDGQIVIAVVVAGSTTDSRFDATEVADFGTYYYAVSADNTHDVSKSQTGETAATIKGGGTPTLFAVAAGESVTVTITTDATAKTYKVYRAVANQTLPASYQLIGEIRNTGATVVFTDKNHVISHTLGNDDSTVQATTRAFAFTLPTFEAAQAAKMRMQTQYPGDVQDAVKRIELAPIFTRPLAITADVAMRELLLAYTAVEVPKPKQCVRFINAGNRNIGTAP